MEFTNVFVEHSGADQSPEGRRRKLERDLRILHQDLAERPEHSFVLFNLGMTYADASEHGRACEFLRRCLKVASPDETQVRKAYALLVSSLMALRYFDEAAQVCAQGRGLFPRDPELLFRAGLLDQEFGRPAEAAIKYRQALRPRDERHFSSLDVGIVGSSTRHNLALAEAARGRHDLAEVQWRRIVREQPENRVAWRALGKQLLVQGRSASLAALVARAERHPALALEAVVLRGRLAWTRGDFDLAEQLLRQATEREPQSLEAWQAWGQFLFERGDPVAAESALRRLTELDSADAAAWHNWGTILARLGRLSEAESALRKSLELRPGDAATERDLAALTSARELPSAIRTPPAEPKIPPAASSKCANPHQLPSCPARRDFDPATERYYCAHPRVGTAGGRVSPEFCRACLLSAEPMPTALREIPPPLKITGAQQCRHLGAVIGERECESCRGKVLVKVFACGHVDHRETTWLECRSCADRSPLEAIGKIV